MHRKGATVVVMGGGIMGLTMVIAGRRGQAPDPVGSARGDARWPGASAPRYDRSGARPLEERVMG